NPTTESASETTQETSEPTTTGSETDTESDTGPETGEPVALPTGPLKAGVAVGHLTRPIGVSMAGYGSRTPTTDTPWNNTLNASRGMYGLPSVKAMALEVAGERLILLKLPTMSGEASLTDGIADKLEQLYGIDLRGRILTGATHSHHTHARYWRLPDALAVVGCDSPDEEVIDELTTVFAETIKRALDDLQPAHWGYTHQDDWDPDDRIYRDRRDENNPTYAKDPRLTLLAVRRTSGAPMGVIINFGMHGTVFGSGNELLTEDAPGGIELKFEEYFYQREGQPIFGMFIQSGGADAAPAGGSLGHPDPARIEVIGEEAAPKIYDLYEQITWRAEASLGVQSQRIDLRYDAIGYDESDEFLSPQNRPFLWGGWQCTGSDDDVDDNNPETSMAGKPKDCLDLEGLLTALGQQIPHGEVHQTYLTSAVLGNLVLMSLPGEPAASVINYMREELTTRTYQGEPVTGMAFGYSQDHLLYLTHPDDWLQGGYETEMSLWGPLLAKYIVDRQVETIDNLLAGVHAPVWTEESENLSPKPDTPWEPRAYEVSLNPGQAVLDPEPVIERGQTLRFGFNGGDASISVPHV
ncbi:MAG: neutral/alkaline non-lysosomal ceramidase N-terminal domain-containing protein, partial [Nannocystaceae bacterium]